jgi:hypothetical protein
MADISKGLDDVSRKLNTVEAQVQRTGGGLRVEGLRRTGGALSQLGLGEVGGVVSRAGDIGQIVKEGNALIGALGPLAPVMAGVAGATLGVQIGMKVLGEELSGSKKALDAATAGLQAYYQAVQNGTTESLQNQLKALRQKNDAEMQELEVLKAARDKGFQAAQTAYGDLGARILVGIGQAEGTFKALDDRIAELEKSTTVTGGQMAALDRAIQSTAVAANDAADALKAQQAEQLRIAEYNAQIDRQRLQDAKLTSEQGRQRVKDLQDELKVVQDEMAAIEGLTQTNDDARKKYEELKDRASALSGEIHTLTTELIPAAKAAEGFKDALDKIKTLGQTLSDAARRAFEWAGKELEDRDKRLADLAQRHNADVQAVEERSLQQRAEIQKRYNDKLVELARNLADEAAASLRRLEQQQADLATTFGRDEQKAQREASYQLLEQRIKAAREDEKAARDHYQRLAEIRQSAADREFDLILNRDFLGLFQSRRQTGRDLERENAQYNEQRQQRQQALEQQIQDDARNFERQRQERLIAYQQQLADAKLAYQRDLAEQRLKYNQERMLAGQQRNQDLRDLQSKTVNELRLKQQSYDAELRLAAMYGQARINAEAKIQQALVAQAEQRLRALGVPSVSGGSFAFPVTNNNSRTTSNVFNFPTSIDPRSVTGQVLNILRRIIS